MAALAVRRARRSVREPAMAVSRLKTHPRPLPGAPNVEKLSQEQWASREVRKSSKGLNTQSNNPQRASATVLVELGGGEHCRDEHTVLPRFRALLER